MTNIRCMLKSYRKKKK